MPLPNDSETTMTEPVEAHCWVAWPAAERKGRTTVLVGVILILAAIVSFVGGDWVWGFTGAVLLILSLNRWFLPSTFRVSAERLEVGYPLARRSIVWSDVRRVAVDSRGGWISRRARASRFDLRSGLDMYWGRQPEQNIAAVIEAVRGAEALGVPLKFTDSRESS